MKCCFSAKKRDGQIHIFDHPFFNILPITNGRLFYNHAAPTIINKINNTTISAKPPSYPPLMKAPP